MDGWIGVDLDGTLAYYDAFVAPDVIGAPIPRMLDRVKEWISKGREVKIFTARVYPYAVDPYMRADDVVDPFDYERQYDASVKAYEAIKQWSNKHIGKEIPITCVKDYHMYELYDDRAKQVLPNTGLLLEEVSGWQTFTGEENAIPKQS